MCFQCILRTKEYCTSHSVDKLKNMYMHMIILFIEYFVFRNLEYHIIFYNVHNCTDCIYGEQRDCLKSGSDHDHVLCFGKTYIW